VPFAGVQDSLFVANNVVREELVQKTITRSTCSILSHSLAAFVLLLALIQWNDKGVNS
jgi:hypothetical protein